MKPTAPIGLVLLGLSVSASATQRLQARQVSGLDVMRIKSGLLEVDGRVTTCELGVIDNKASFVSAACLSFTQSGGVDPKTKYRVLLDDGMDELSSAFDVTNVAVSAGYKKGGIANNMAVVEYNERAAKDWSQHFAVGIEDWQSVVFASRVIESAQSNKWTYPVFASQNDESEDSCDKSSLFTQNKGDLLCQTLTMARAGSNCKRSYGSAYMVASGFLYNAALFSHAAIETGDDACDFDVEGNYFVAFANYLAFAQDVIGRNISIFAVKNSKGFSISSDPKYSMVVPTSDDAGIWYVGGDLDHETRLSVLGDKPQNGGNNSGNSGNSGNNGSGMSKTVKIVVGVCVPVGVIILSIIGYLVYRHGKKRGAGEMRQQDAYGADVQGVANETGGATINDRPPSYQSVIEEADGEASTTRIPQPVSEPPLKSR